MTDMESSPSVARRVTTGTGSVRYMTQDAMRELGRGIALALYEMACDEGL